MFEIAYSPQSWASLLNDEIHDAPLQDLDNILLSHPNRSSLSATLLIGSAPQWVIPRLTGVLQATLPNAYKHGIVAVAIDRGSYHRFITWRGTREYANSYQSCYSLRGPATRQPRCADSLPLREMDRNVRRRLWLHHQHTGHL